MSSNYYERSCSSNSFCLRIMGTVNRIFGLISGTQGSPLLGKQRHAVAGPEGWQPAVGIPEANESDILNKGNTLFPCSVSYSLSLKGKQRRYHGSLISVTSRNHPSTQ
jgi:hypothetical protein